MLVILYYVMHVHTNSMIQELHLDGKGMHNQAMASNRLETLSNNRMESLVKTSSNNLTYQHQFDSD